jgi:hypothetical protein
MEALNAGIPNNTGYLVGNQLATLTQYNGAIKHIDNQLPPQKG